MRLAVVGIALGAGGALVLTRLLAGLLYGIGASDPGTFGAAAILLGLVAVLAGLGSIHDGPLPQSDAPVGRDCPCSEKG